MVNRRNFAGLVGIGAAAAASSLSKPALAQSSDESTWDKIMRTKKLRIGAVATGAPWTMKNVASGEWSGQFIAMGRALAQDMGVELEIVETQWGNAIMDLQANKVDVMFGMNLTPARALVVDFTTTVYESALVVIAKPGYEPKTWEDMNKPEAKLGVDVGSAHDQILTRMCPNAQISRFKTLDDASMALRSGRIDAQCLFWMGAVRAVKRDPKIGSVVVPQPLFGSTSNACIRREKDKTLRDFLDNWITYAKYMGLIRTAVLDSLAAVDLSISDIPEGVTF
ncbi:ABC transporter substrate-binding protein [Ochrobactrum sp. P6BS-III]|uniref:transporter substrate-binding domain-containing protein n=1 Tax=unclassified Ochrobactrum TaxID=239106 RepID=UPI0009947A7F|nr:polar amino acid transport system substrate-binding protein [Ochrobactrum sp. P6BSIII]OOL15182.1 ABC transporter substrate-binding protein [Ochrobactrum sp. P6BS-III]